MLSTPTSMTSNPARATQTPVCRSPIENPVVSLACWTTNNTRVAAPMSQATNRTRRERKITPTTATTVTRASGSATEVQYDDACSVTPDWKSRSSGVL
jgi:hypothetical protein